MGLAEWYPQLRALHVTCAAASFAFFVLRGIWMMRAPHLLALGWVRVVPHAIDTILLASALALAFTLQQYPFVDGWLTAKVFGLIAYIVLGTIALKRGRTPRIRGAAFVGAIATFLYIASVAHTHRPWPF